MYIVHTHSEDLGWQPINHMVSLLSRLSGTDVVSVPYEKPWSRLEKLASVVPRAHRGVQDLLVVSPVPGNLLSLTEFPGWRHTLRKVSAWVIDSWWDDRIPRLAKRLGQFDTIYISEAENIDAWREITGADIVHLPIGADVLGNAFDPSAGRDIDLLRVGRMPEMWEDEVLVGTEAARRGLRFMGRPPLAANASEAMDMLWSWERRARFVAAFSNRVSAAAYTHPTREYLTPRWADAWSSGARTVGALPATSSAALLAGESNIELPFDDVGAAMDLLAAHVHAWTPATAVRTRLHALAHVDWRHRFSVIQDGFGEQWEALGAEHRQLVREQEDLRALV